MPLTPQERNRLLQQMQDGHVETASLEAVQDVVAELERATDLITRMGATLGFLTLYDTAIPLKQDALLLVAEADVFLENVTDNTPDGTPGVRDRRSPCPDYDPRERALGDVEDCVGDGHYLCNMCKHKDYESE